MSVSGDENTNSNLLNDSKFKKLEADVHKLLHVYSKLNLNDYISYGNSAEDAYMVISGLQENYRGALSCIGINCRGIIRVGSPSYINCIPGKTGDQIAEMSLEDFLAFMRSLEY